MSQALKLCTADELRQGYRSTFMWHVKNMLLHDISFLSHMGCYPVIVPYVAVLTHLRTKG